MSVTHCPFVVDAGAVIGVVHDIRGALVEAGFELGNLQKLRVDGFVVEAQRHLYAADMRAQILTDLIVDEEPGESRAFVRGAFQLRPEFAALVDGRAQHQTQEIGVPAAVVVGAQVEVVACLEVVLIAETMDREAVAEIVGKG